MESSLILNSLDISIIAAYFIIVFILAVVVTGMGKNKTSEDYFLAGRNTGWFLVGASLFATNIGSEHLIGLAGAGAKSGVAVAQFEVLACFLLLLLGWFFVPFYIRSSVTTMPEFLELRFSKRARNYLTFISVCGYVLTKISVTIYAGAIVFEAIGVPFWIGALCVVTLTGIYTVVGGLKAVIYTDAAQMIVMIAGSIFITYFGLQRLGGIDVLTSTLDKEFFSMWKPMTDKDFPWTGILFGAPILGVWYWCTDQFIVQRTLAAQNIQQARRGSIFAGYLKLLPLFLFVVPGMICLALTKIDAFQLSKPDMALPTLAANVLPTGFRGFFIAGLLAALMSSLASVFNSCSTLVTYDIFKQYFPKASEKKLIQIGRLSTGILVLLGIAWIPLMKLISGGIFQYIQSVQAYISPPVAAVFLVGILWKRINACGAQTALYAGFVIGLTRLVLEINKSSLNVSGWPYFIADMNFLHFAIWLFVIAVVLMIVVSLFTLPDGKKIDSLTVNWKSLREANGKRKDKLDLGLSVGLVALVFGMWWYFS